MRTRVFCAGALTIHTRFSESKPVGVVCTSAGFLILSTAALSAVHIATGAVETIDTGDTELKSPLGLALSDSQRVVYIANSEANQIETVALPARYFTDA